MGLVCRVTLKFTARDKWNKPVVVQQAFVRVAAEGSEREAIYVAETDASGAYRVDLVSGATTATVELVELDQLAGMGGTSWS